jgi:hypothetical protein
VSLVQRGEESSAKSTKSSPWIDPIREVGHAICRVGRNIGTLRMFGGGVLKPRRLVSLAGRSGAFRNRLANSLPHETSVAFWERHHYQDEEVRVYQPSAQCSVA